MAFQVFKRNRVTDPMVGHVGTIDLTDGDQVIVDLVGVPPAFTPHLGDAPGDAERISAWADRMRQKRLRDQAAILGETADQPSSAGYWSSAHVSGGDDPTAEPGVVADPSRRARLLGELGLSGDATSEDVAGAYRQLAKRHHPDRWAEADEETRRSNAEEMMRVNAVYRALRISGDVAPRGRASTPPGPPAPGPR
ncbi:MAG: J domain-containing protein [Acidimicrobiales bacterium]